MNSLDTVRICQLIFTEDEGCMTHTEQLHSSICMLMSNTNSMLMHACMVLQDYYTHYIYCVIHFMEFVHPNQMNQTLTKMTLVD